ncbi:hypothetical protein EKH55_2256 [Sinorhizobium alkalisoli]|nr:hypothetical protein EKH55_2256 [Sinorhizobium alkalisoli]
MPRRAGGELVLLQEHAIAPSGSGKVVERGGPDGSPANDHDACVRRQTRHALSLFCRDI